MSAEPRFPTIGDGSGLDATDRLYPEELQLASRNKALPLEGLRYDVTPVGLHYTLVHYDIPDVEADTWRLTIGGRVRRPLTLSFAELQQRPARTLRVTLECAGNGRALLAPRPVSQPWLTGAVGTAEWTGTPLRPLLEEAGLGEDVGEIVFTGHDRGYEGGVEQEYQRSLPLQDALHNDVILAWAMNGAPLEPQHGYPVRLVVPGWYGMAHVKWLRAIEASTAPFAGYHQAVAYRYSQARTEPGEPVTLLRVRSLMIPPGIPDFLTRVRVVRRGQVALHGRAWSGQAAITRVEVSADGGASWAAAAVDAPPGPYCWQAWRYVWEATDPGEYELCCRAHDSAGNVQPVEQYWTARGMGNNMAQRVRVQVV
ncbi:MAG TPA: sulfite oxidase [Thermomicrobiales bacterium]|nr:sulfite oxidase [Thermomicrobiales bacterium]